MKEMNKRSEFATYSIGSQGGIHISFRCPPQDLRALMKAATVELGKALKEFDIHEEEYKGDGDGRQGYA